MLHGYPVFRCTDGFLRDTLSTRFKVREMRNELTELLPFIKGLLDELHIQEAILVIDKPIPWSRKMANSIAEISWNNKVIVELGRADTLLIKHSLNGYNIATSDIVILQQAEKAIDLPSLLAEYLWGGFPGQCSITEIIDSWYTRACSRRNRFIRSNSST